jgi:hypothetical protein
MDEGTILVYCCPSIFSLTSPPPPFPNEMYSIYRQCVSEGGGGLNCTVEHILQDFTLCFLTRIRTYKIASPPQTKEPVKATLRDWCLSSSFVHDFLSLFTQFLLQGNGANVFLFSVVFTPSPPMQPPLQCLGPTCHLSTLSKHCIGRCGLALSYDWRGFVRPKKKTIVGLLVFNPLCSKVFILRRLYCNRLDRAQQHRQPQSKCW